MAAAKETYHQLMDAICGGPKPYLSADQMEIEHIRCKDKALEQFQAKRKMGGDEFSESYRCRLESVIINIMLIISRLCKIRKNKKKICYRTKCCDFYFYFFLFFLQS